MPLHTRPWKKLSGQLALATEHDFPRRALPVLRLFWPALIETPHRRAWDAKGIDLLVWNDTEPFPCVVQAKGFDVRALGADQIRQARESINKFARSGERCHTYVFLHNRDGSFVDFNAQIGADLNKLIAAEIVVEAKLWDRQTFLVEAADRLQEMLVEALRRRSREILRRFLDLFPSASRYIPTVPLTEKRLVLKRTEPAEYELISPLQSRDIQNVLSSATDCGWTLLKGRFGAGKTSAVLHAATTWQRPVVFVPCAALPSTPAPASTNELLEEVLKSLSLFDEFETDHQAILYELSGAALASFLRRPESPYVLVLDGLDENRAFSTIKGLQRLANQVTELMCLTILTTRAEHFEERYGDFSLAFGEFSVKRGSRRNARVLELEPWEAAQVLQFLEAVYVHLDSPGQARLSEFIELLRQEAHTELYRELPFNPLFLQFIVEDVIAEGLRRTDRAGLLGRWVRRKIERDRRIAERPGLDESIDAQDFVERMVRLMENVAHLMIEKKGRLELVETIDADRVRHEASALFNTSGDPILGVLLNSLLEPQGPRRGLMFSLRFSLRIFQEYFLASYLARKQEPPDNYPDPVGALHREIVLGT